MLHQKLGAAFLEFTCIIHVLLKETHFSFFSPVTNHIMSKVFKYVNIFSKCINIQSNVYQCLADTLEKGRYACANIHFTLRKELAHDKLQKC